MDYERLKKLLKESVLKRSEMKAQSSKHQKGRGEDEDAWSEGDESNFVAALDEELEKVYGFQIKKFNTLMDKLNRLEEQTDDEATIKSLDFVNFQHALEESLSEAQELDNFSRLNFTGFIKIVKKHDKLHPKYPSVKSLLQVRLKELPFHSEEYSPLLYKISFLYNILRNNFTTVSKSLANSSKLSSVNNTEEISFQSFKFWVHPDNLMEVKTRILRHLPVLVYAATPGENDDLINRLEADILDADDSIPSCSTSSNGTEDGDMSKGYDPVINTLYFDNDYFELYNNKLLKTNSAPTLRLRWTGKLADKPDIFFEKRMFVEDSKTGSSDFEEIRLKLKQKFINGFIFNGDDEFKERMLRKLKDRGTMNNEISKLSDDFDSVQTFVLENELQPVLRTMYTRTAFQIPGDDRVRITIDSDIMYIREDAFDKDRPIRDPTNWHRSDIDANVAHPMKFLRAGEYAKFPYSVMEIKVKNPVKSTSAVDNTMSSTQLPRKHGKWIGELTNSHLVKEVPRFSKYIQGVASLFGEDEKLDMLPFWLPDLEYDIRKDPKQAYEEEKKKLKKQKETEAKMSKIKRLSTVAQIEEVRTPSDQDQEQLDFASSPNEREADLEDHESSDEEYTTHKRRKQKSKRDPNFFRVLAGRNSKLTGVDSEDEEVDLPQGVKKPTSYIKNAGPIKVEAKVWLANERTFNRWLSVTSLLSALTFSIYNSVKKAEFPQLATTMAYIYFALTIFTGIWSYVTYVKRLDVIRERSGKHLDSPLGPLLLATVLIVTLVINFVFAFKEAAQRKHDASISAVALMDSPQQLPRNLERIQEFIFRLIGARSSSSK